MATKQVPSTGRVVHFFMPEDEIEYAALITGVGPEPRPESVVDLAVFNTDGIFFSTGVPHKSQAEGRSCWDWPPHVPPAEVPDDAP